MFPIKYRNYLFKMPAICMTCFSCWKSLKNVLREAGVKNLSFYISKLKRLHLLVPVIPVGLNLFWQGSSSWRLLAVVQSSRFKPLQGLQRQILQRFFSCLMIRRRPHIRRHHRYVSWKRISPVPIIASSSSSLWGSAENSNKRRLVFWTI